MRSSTYPPNPLGMLRPMRPILIPDREADFTADPAELFFDLSYVFAFSQLVAVLLAKPYWSTVADVSLLLLMMWLPWTQFTWSANAVAGNSRTVRLIFLAATVASIPMGASVSTALGDGGMIFVISLAVIMVIALYTMLIGVADDDEVRRSLLTWSVPNFVAMAAMILGAFLDGGARELVWLGAMGVVVAGTVRAGQGAWLVRPGHFAERHGLVVIVALGEVVVAIGVAVNHSLEDGHGLPAQLLLALIASGIFAGLCWWGYFDRPSHAIERRHTEVEEPIFRARFARDVYTYAHLPLVAGILVAAAGLEGIALHPSDDVAVAVRAMLIGGVVLFLACIVIAVRRAFHVWAVERIAAVGALVGLGVLAGSLNGLWFLAIVDLILLAMLAAEHRRIEGPSAQAVGS